jgi:hypothetical protein
MKIAIATTLALASLSSIAIPAVAHADPCDHDGRASYGYGSEYGPSYYQAPRQAYFRPVQARPTYAPQYRERGEWRHGGEGWGYGRGYGWHGGWRR